MPEIYFHDTFIIDLIVGITGIFAGLIIGYLILKTHFKIQDHQGHIQNKEVERAWATLSIIENRRSHILNQWYTRQISTRQRDILLTPLVKRHQEAEANWIRAGSK